MGMCRTVYVDRSFMVVINNLLKIILYYETDDQEYLNRKQAHGW